MKTLLNLIANRGNLKRAWFSIKKRPDSRGFDDVTIKDFEINLTRNIAKIKADLLANKYEFTLLRGVAIAKDGKKGIRPLKIPAIKDRVVQKAIVMAIHSHLAKKYKLDNTASFAYLEDRSVEDAALKIQSLYKEKFGWIYSGDIEKFFDRVDIDILLNKLIYPCLPDKTINKLIKKALTIEIGNAEALKKLGVYEDFPAAGSGIPQGGILSPLFANVYLNPLDMAMIGGGFQMVRYADDFVILCKTKEDAIKADLLARSIVEKKLKLHIYDTQFAHVKATEKYSYIGKFESLEFLGLRFRGEKIYPAPKQFQKIVKKLRTQAEYSKDFKLIPRLNYLRSRVQNWGANYHYTTFEGELYQGLDKELFTIVNKIFLMCGYKLISGTNPQDILNKVGMHTFTQSLDKYKNEIPERRRKRAETEKINSIKLAHQETNQKTT